MVLTKICMNIFCPATPHKLLHLLVIFLIARWLRDMLVFCYARKLMLCESMFRETMQETRDDHMLVNWRETWLNGRRTPAGIYGTLQHNSCRSTKHSFLFTCSVHWFTVLIYWSVRYCILWLSDMAYTNHSSLDWSVLWLVHLSLPTYILGNTSFVAYRCLICEAVLLVHIW